MDTPVFEDVAPASDCACPGCADRRRTQARGLPVRLGGNPAAHGARRHALVLAAAAGTVLSSTNAPTALAAEVRPPGQGLTTAGEGVMALTGGAAVHTPGFVPPAGGAGAGVLDDGTATPQGATSPLHGASPSTSATPVSTGFPATTRAEIINRAKTWINAKVPYSMSKYWSDGYRQDCSGFISMAWGLPGNEWTGSLARFGVRITKNELQPGDMLLFHNPSDPNKGSHVTIFGGWTDYTRQYYVAYEQAPPKSRKQATPYGYWSNASSYVPYRYRGVKAGTGGGTDTGTAPGTGTGSAGPTGSAFPGASKFGPGANNRHVTELGRMLAERGGSRYYRSGPGPRWSDADRRATEAFQKAQGWKGSAADGIPGPRTWDHLVKGRGRDIPAPGTPGGGSRPGGSAGSPGAPAEADFPGRGYFRPGQSNSYVTQLGKQLVRKGFGKYYTQGPGPRWGESDRRNLEAFQRAQGWRGGAADGYPGPETWRRLFS
ncbi:peptidoglycan-binding protein [Streptomyces uncialis]|uniref:peptidoglycan-binding protein n=1 Tax=Streptomyces uncialis TaxID=1048205 RepID=UPI00386719F8|nr:peptidoglycan-binding protein [Streptomyces uncialis]